MVNSLRSLLDAVAWARIAYEGVCDKLDEARTKCTSTTSRISPTGGSGGGSDRDWKLTVLADLETEEAAAFKRMTALEVEALSFLQTFSEQHPRYAHLLLERYIRRKQWTDILADMPEEDRVTYRTLMNWHKKALEEGEKLWNETHNEP